MDFCSNCNNTKQDHFLRTSHEIICKSCGYFVEESMIDLSPDWSTYDKESAVYDTNSRCSPSESVLKKKGIHDVFREIVPVIQELDVGIWNDAKRLYDKQGNVKSNNKKTAAVACVYLALRQLNSGIISKSELCKATCVGSTEFSLALTTLKEAICDDPMFSHLIKKRSKIEDVLFRMLNSVPEIESHNFQKIKSLVFKLYGRIGEDKELMGMPSEKVTASLIYIACKSLRIEFKLKDFCSVIDTSCSSVFRIERAVRNACV